ncbi:hypothetical protein MferCBS31731_001956 [Microsporum ferrugineum]
MDYLSSLPAELRSMIAEMCDKSSCLSLALVSTYFRETAQRSLYYEIDQVLKRPEGIRTMEYPGQRQTPWIELLLRTMLERPGLSRYVRKVRWTLHPERYHALHSRIKLKQNMGKGIKAKVDPNLVEMGIKIKKRNLFFAHEWDWESTWDAALFEGNIDAMMALVLAQFDLLVSLELAPDFLYRSRFLGLMFRCMTSSMPEHSHFRHLRHVAFCERENGRMAEKPDPSIDENISILRTRRIETLELTLHDYHLRVMVHDLLTTHPYLTTLRLWFCNLGTYPVGRILDFTPAIKVLHCGIQRDSTSFDPFSALDFAAFTSDLGRVAGTLEELTIHLIWRHLDIPLYMYYLSPFAGKPLRSLQFLHNLLHLEVPAGLLIGKRPWHGILLPHMLPPNLQSLVLIDTYIPYHCHIESGGSRDSINQVIAYLDRRSRYTPCLQKVTLKTMVPIVLPSKNGQDYGRVYVSNRQIADLTRVVEASGVTVDILLVTSLSESDILWQRTIVA